MQFHALPHRLDTKGSVVTKALKSPNSVSANNRIQDSISLRTLSGQESSPKKFPEDNHLKTTTNSVNTICAALTIPTLLWHITKPEQSSIAKSFCFYCHPSTRYYKSRIAAPEQLHINIICFTHERANCNEKCIIMVPSL